MSTAGRVIAIDPGLTGAIAVYHNGMLLQVYDMPTRVKSVTRKRNKTTGKMQNYMKYEVDAHALGGILHESLSNLTGTRECVIEKVAARPGQGVVSMFGFGDSFGVVRAICAYLVGNENVHRVLPAQWKKHFGLIHQDKDTARLKAIKLFGSFGGLLNRKKDIGRADAILIGLHHLEKGVN